MKTKSVVKGTLATISMTLVGTGATMLMAKDYYGLILMGVGFAIIFYKEWYNNRVK